MLVVASTTVAEVLLVLKIAFLVLLYLFVVRVIRSVTREPIRWLVLTHHHPDHHFGAVVLRRAGARVIAHPDVSTGVDEQSRAAAESTWTLVVGRDQMAGFAYAGAHRMRGAYTATAPGTSA